MGKLKNRILVVDDSPTILAATKALLEADGFEVEVSHDAWIARQVQEFRPDLLLIDVRLHGATGDSLVKSLRARKSIVGSAKMILYSTADGLGELAERCGADGAIEKDVRPDVMLARVRAYLAQG